jgi:hypothetical protein
MAINLKPAKAQKMLEHGRVRGDRITRKQRKLFQAVAAGWKPDNPFRKLRQR